MLKNCSFFILLLAVLPLNVFAYLDPGTGSFVIQAVIATLAGVSFAAKTYWGKIKTFSAGILSRIRKNKSDGE